MNVRLAAAVALALALTACTNAEIKPSPSRVLSTHVVATDVPATVPPASSLATPQASMAILTKATSQRWPAGGSNRGAEYRAGSYYWEGASGWMHNGYQQHGPGGGVEITFAIVPSGYVPGQTKVTIAGHDGTYRESIVAGGRRQVWLVEIEGKNVMIVLGQKPATTPEEVAEAREIIASIQYEEDDSNLGFTLLFMIPPGWDSG